MAVITAFFIICYLFWLLFIRGTIWPIFLFVFGVFGGSTLILNWFPTSNKTIITIASYNINIATLVAAIIVILGIGTLMENNNE